MRGHPRRSLLPIHDVSTPSRFACHARIVWASLVRSVTRRGLEPTTGTSKAPPIFLFLCRTNEPRDSPESSSGPLFVWGPCPRLGLLLLRLSRQIPQLTLGYPEFRSPSNFRRSFLTYLTRRWLLSRYKLPQVQPISGSCFSGSPACLHYPFPGPPRSRLNLCLSVRRACSELKPGEPRRTALARRVEFRARYDSPRPSYHQLNDILRAETGRGALALKSAVHNDNGQNICEKSKCPQQDTVKTNPYVIFLPDARSFYA